MLRLMTWLVALVVLTGTAAAQDITDKAKEAEALAASGKFVEAIAALDQAATALWEKAPLSFRRALWVAEPPQGFGAYNPRETNVYAAGDSMIAYVEPFGFGWKKAGDVWRTDIIADLVIKSKKGEVLLRKPDFQKLQLGSRVRNREFMTRFTYTLTGIPPGEYVCETTLRDAVTGKSGTFALPFVIH